MKRARLAAPLASLLLVFACERTPDSEPTNPSDRVTVRIHYKVQGAPFSSWGCMLATDDWGWDSTTFEGKTGDFSNLSFYTHDLGLRIGRTVGRDSVWLHYSRAQMVPRSAPRTGEEFVHGTVVSSDSVLLTLRPVRFQDLWVDGGTEFSINLVAPSPASKQEVRRTTLRGVVLDGETRQGLDYAHVFVLGTKLTAQTDTLGHFEIAGVPLGTIRVTACRGGLWHRDSVCISTPSTPIELHLLPRHSFNEPP